MRQIDKVQDLCQRAYFAHTPVVYLVTDDYCLIDEIVKRNSFCEMVYQYEGDYLTRSELPDDAEVEEPVNYVKCIGTVPDPFPKENLKNYSGPKIPQVAVVYNYDTVARSGDAEISRYVMDYMTGNREYVKKSLLILAGSSIAIPGGLENYIHVIDVPALETDEIREIIDECIAVEKKRGRNISEDYYNELITRCMGFSRNKIVEMLHAIRADYGSVCDDGDAHLPEKVYEFINNEKGQALKKTDILEHIEIGKKKICSGGLENLKGWIGTQKKILKEREARAKKWNVEFAKGLLITGVPGCGKSLMAKYTAQEFKVPLIQMDLGKLQNSLHGESEARMRRALKLVEAMAPCVLWIDEVEKAFAGTRGSGESDGGTGQRIFATFLTWLQERKLPIFAFITANDISKLPSEFLRLGRVSKKYSISMPTYDECVEIFKHNIEKRNENPALFDEGILKEDYWKDILEECGKSKKFLTGGDIEEAVKAAMINYYISENDYSQSFYEANKFKSIMIKQLKEMSPYGETNMEEIVKFQLLQEKNKFEIASDNTIISAPLHSLLEKRNEKSFEKAYDSCLFNEILNTYEELIKNDREKEK